MSPEAAACAIVIPTFNQARFLGEAIESCLAQTVPVHQIIVVDDGSNDDPGAVAARYDGVIFIRQANGGPSAARNAGIAAATAPCIAFLDADDRLLPRAMEGGLACLASQPDAVLAYGAFRLTDANGTPYTRALLTRTAPRGAYEKLLRRGNFIGMLATVLFRREALTAVGGFDENLRLCEDYELYLRLANHGRFAVHAGLVAEYRQHGSSASADRLRLLAAALKVLDRQKQLRPDLAASIAQGRGWWRNYYSHEIARRSLRRIRREGLSTDAVWFLARAMALAPLRLPLRLARKTLRLASGLRRSDAASREPSESP